MRLLYVIDSLAPGGAEVSLAAMAPGLVAAGIDLHVLPLHEPLDLAPIIASAGGTVHTGSAGRDRLGNYRAVLETARSLRPTLVHTTLFEADIAGRAAARLLNVPSSTSLVSDTYGPAHRSENHPLKVRAAQLVDFSTARFATRFHAVSHAVAKSVGPRLGIPDGRIDVIPRGRSAKDLPFQSEDVRRKLRGRLGVAESVPLLLAVGRLEPAKGLEHLLDAVSLLMAPYPDLVVLIAGKDGSSSAPLRERASRIPGRIEFLGHRSDVPGLLAAADVLCFPSLREGSPGTLIEALAVGCPIVSSGIDPVREIVGAQSGDTALLTPTGDAEALSHSISRTLSETAETSARTRRGRIRFESRFELEKVLLQMQDFFLRAQKEV